jgi:hypothetical protein
MSLEWAEPEHSLVRDQGVGVAHPFYSAMLPPPANGSLKGSPRQSSLESTVAASPQGRQHEFRRFAIRAANGANDPTIYNVIAAIQGPKLKPSSI